MFNRVISYNKVFFKKVCQEETISHRLCLESMLMGPQFIARSLWSLMIVRWRLQQQIGVCMGKVIRFSMFQQIQTL